MSEAADAQTAIHHRRLNLQGLSNTVATVVRGGEGPARDAIGGPTAVTCAAVLGLAIAAGIAIGHGHWNHVGVWVTLVAFAVLGDLSSRHLGGLSVSNTTIPIAVSTVVFGVLPSIVLALIVVGVGDGLRGRWRFMSVNAAGLAVFCLASGLVLEAARSDGALPVSEGSLALWAALATTAGETANFVTVAASARMDGQSTRSMLRASLIPMLPYELFGITGAALTVYAYRSLGYVALPASALLTAALAWTLHLLSRDELRGVALDEARRERDDLSQQLVSAEERARRALAADLHDDALQLLAVARHDLDDGAVERARAQLDAVDGSLRDLLVRLDAFGTRTTVSAAFDELIATIGTRSGLQIECDLDRRLSDIVDADLVSCARELLLNVEKHAEADRVWVTASPGVLSVVDDGRGGTIDIAAALERGHLGLALVARRARDRGGDLTFASRSEGGLAVRLTFVKGLT